MKSFDLAQVLSITTSRLCCDMGGVYDILNHATGDNLFTHVLPRACRFAAPLILALYPQLEAAGSVKNVARLDELIENVKARGESPMEGVKMWLAWMKESGLEDSYEIPNWGDRWLSLDPMAEAVSMVGKDKVIGVSVAGRAAAEGSADETGEAKSGAGSASAKLCEPAPEDVR